MNHPDLHSKLKFLFPAIDWKPDPTAVIPTCTARIANGKTVTIEASDSKIRIDMSDFTWWDDARSLDECQGAIANHLEWFRQYQPKHREAVEPPPQIKSRYKVKPL